MRHRNTTFIRKLLDRQEQRYPRKLFPFTPACACSWRGVPSRDKDEANRQFEHHANAQLRNPMNLSHDIERR